MCPRLIWILLYVCTCCTLFSQRDYTLNGAAVNLDGLQRFELTSAESLVPQHGTIWNNVQINLNNSFTLIVNLNFGDIDELGADGIGFGFHQEGTEAGTEDNGLELGLGGIIPSLFVEFDTWQNNGEPDWNTDYGDPIYDHLSIFRDGYFRHGSPNELIEEPLRILDGVDNIEDGNDYYVRFEWDAPAQLFTVFVNCQQRAVLSMDIVNDIFNGDPMVYWGFGAATGFAKNNQEVEFLYYSTELQDKAICSGSSVVIGDTEQEAFTDVFYQWTPTQGVAQPNAPVTSVSPTENTTYTLTISDACGFVASEEVEVLVEDQKVLTIEASRDILCPGDSIILTASSSEIRWGDGSTTNPRVVRDAGRYSLESTSNCPGSASILVLEADPLPQQFLPNDTVLCGVASLDIDLSSLPHTILWSDGLEGNQRTLSGGQYTASISNECETVFDTITISTISRLEPFMPEDVTICPQETFDFELEGLPGTIQWNDGFEGNTRTLESGNTYVGTLSNACGSVTDSIQIFEHEAFEPQNFSLDTLICGDSIYLDLDTVVYAITWSDGRTTNARWFTNGSYSGYISDVCGADTSSINIRSVPALPNRFLPDDEVICPGDEVPVDLTATGATTVEWSDGSTAFQRTLGGGTHVAILTNDCFRKVDTIVLSTTAAIDSLLPDDFSICAEDSVIVRLPNNTRWEDDAPSNRAIRVGTYYAIYDNGCVVKEDTLVVTPIELPPSNFLPADTIICAGSTVTITNSDYVPYTLSWADDFTASVRDLEAGLYQAYLDGVCGQSTDSILIEYIAVPSDSFLPPDTVLCFGDSLEIDLSDGPILEWQDGVSSNKRSIAFGKYVAQKPYACGTVTDSISIGRHPEPPARFLPFDTTVCETDSVMIQIAPLQDMFIEWSDGSTAWSRTGYPNDMLQATIRNICGTVQNSMNIASVPQVPERFLPADTVLCAGEFLSFDPIDLPGIFAWSDDFIASERKLAPGEVYEARLQNICGVQRDKVRIGLARNCANILIPNIFAPDRINEKFSFIDPDGIVRNIRTFEIYNRWGAQVYKVENTDLMDQAAKWDGGNNPAGVYIYLYVLEVEPGITIHLQGDVTLIR